MYNLLENTQPEQLSVAQCPAREPYHVCFWAQELNPARIHSSNSRKDLEECLEILEDEGKVKLLEFSLENKWMKILTIVFQYARCSEEKK